MLKCFSFVRGDPTTRPSTPGRAGAALANIVLILHTIKETSLLPFAATVATIVVVAVVAPRSCNVLALNAILMFLRHLQLIFTKQQQCLVGKQNREVRQGEGGRTVKLCICICG